MSDVARAEVHLVLIHQVGPEANRLPAERACIDEAARRAELGVLHVAVDELEPVHRADLELGRQRIAPIGFSRIQLSAEIPYRDAEGQRRAGFERELGSEIDRPRALDLRANAAALARTIDAQLNELVVEARRQNVW